jgi:hypothetical protein
MNKAKHFDRALRSRFMEFDFTPRPEEDEQIIKEMSSRCETILAENGSSATRNELNALVTAYYPDLRQVMKYLQLLHISRTNRCQN